jgi:hypothetical protein
MLTPGQLRVMTGALAFALGAVGAMMANEILRALQ